MDFLRDLLGNENVDREISEKNKTESTTEEKEKSDKKIPTEDILKKMEEYFNKRIEEKTQDIRKKVEELNTFKDTALGTVVDTLKQNLLQQYPEIPKDILFSIVQDEISKTGKITDKNIQEFMINVNKRLSDTVDEIADKYDKLVKRNTAKRISKIGFKPLREKKNEDIIKNNLAVLLKLSGIDSNPEKKISLSKSRLPIENVKKAFMERKYQIEPEEFIDAIFEGLENELS